MDELKKKKEEFDMERNKVGDYILSFMENNNDWHHNRLTNSLYEEAIKNLGND